MKKCEKKYIHMNLPVVLINRLDAYANRLGLNRTTALILLLSDALTELEGDQNGK